MLIELTEIPFDPLKALARYQATLSAGQKQYGATASFIGTMRDYNEGESIRAMILEHYPGMTERQLQMIVEDAGQRWQLLDTLIIHRIGTLHPSDPIVLVAVWSTHRKDAFEACRFIMEALKSRAPFWKKEVLARGTRWVEHNTLG